MDIQITVGGVDVTNDAIYSDAIFTSAANGRAGTCQFRIRDLAHIWAFTVGAEIILTIDGVREWGGYLEQLKRGYFFDVEDTKCKCNAVPRYYEIHGSDYSVLLQRRFLYDKAIPAVVQLTQFAPGTADSTIIDYYVANHLDLSGDGVSTALVQTVGSPSTDVPFYGNAGWSWDQFLSAVNYNIGAIYYLDPDKGLVWADVETENAPFELSDHPSASQVGYRSAEILYDGANLINDAMAWGAGQASTQVVFSRIQDAASIATHGRWQVGQALLPIFKQATADRTTRTYVYGSPQNQRGHKDDAIGLKLTLDHSGLRVAQKVRCISDVFGFDQVFPVRSCRITFPTNTQARWELGIGSEYAQPWTGFDFFPFDFKFPPFPPPQIFDLLPPIIPFTPCDTGDNSPSRCCDTFSRTEITGWGAPEFDVAQPWSDTSNTYYSVDGSSGVMQLDPSPPFGQTSYISLSETVTVPFEVLAISHWERDTGNTSLQGFYGIAQMTLDTAGGFSSQPFQQPVTRLEWWYENGTLSNQADSLRVTMQFNRQSPPSFPTFPNQFGPNTTGGTGNFPDARQQNYVRWRVESTAMYVRVWPVGSPEPNSWNIQTTGMTAVPTAFSRINFNMISGGGGGRGFVDGVRFYLDNLCITEGMVCNGNGEVINCNDQDTSVDSGWDGPPAGGGYLIGGEQDPLGSGIPITGACGPIDFVDSSSTAMVFKTRAVWSGDLPQQINIQVYGNVTSCSASDFAGGDFIGTLTFNGTATAPAGLDVSCYAQLRGGFTNWWDDSVHGLNIPQQYWNGTFGFRMTAANNILNRFIFYHGITSGSPCRSLQLGPFFEGHSIPGCAQPCVVPADGPHGYTCLNLTHIDPPPGADTNLLYYSTAASYPGYSYQPGSSDVKFDGLFLRYLYDYTEDYLNGIIAISNPDIIIAYGQQTQQHVVWMCAFFETVVAA